MARTLDNVYASAKLVYDEDEANRLVSVLAKHIEEQRNAEQPRSQSDAF